MLRRIAGFPILEQREIRFKHTERMTLLFKLCLFGNGRIAWCGYGVVKGQREVSRQLPDSLDIAQAINPCGEVNDVACGVAAEAVEVGVVELETGCAVVVKWTADHGAPVGSKAAVLGCLFHSDLRFDGFKRFQKFLFLTSLYLPAGRA